MIKETMFDEKEVIAIEEYYYDSRHQMVKQIQKLEWNNEATKQTRVIDIYTVPDKNEIQLTYNGVLSFIVTIDEKLNPHSNIKGYSIIYAAQFHGITNNTLKFTRINKNGNRDTETSDLTFDSTGKYLLEAKITGNDKRLICKNIYTYYN